MGIPGQLTSTIFENHAAEYFSISHANIFNFELSWKEILKFLIDVLNQKK
jgi:hypothetical protein